MKCKRCGKNVPVHSKVCPGCGLDNPGYVPRPEERTAPHSSHSTSAGSRSTTPPKSTTPPRSTYSSGSASQPKSGPRPAQAQPACAPVPPQSAAKPAEGSSFMKFLLLVAVVVGIVFLLRNCDTIRLKGTWEADDGSSITFSDKDSGYISVSGNTIGSRNLNFTYFVEGDEIELKTEDTLYAYSTVVRFEFEIDGDTLRLTDRDSGITQTFRKR